MSHIHRQINHGTLYAPRHEEAFLPYMQKTSSVASLPRPCLIMKRLFRLKSKRRPRSPRSFGLASLLRSIREVNEAKGGLILAAGRVRSKKKNIREKKTRKNPPHPKHTTNSTAARRPHLTRDGMRGNTSHALAHTRPLH